MIASVSDTYTCIRAGGDIDEVSIGAELNDYFSSLPIDPDISDETTEGTGYFIEKSGNNVIVKACELYDMYGEELWVNPDGLIIEGDEIVYNNYSGYLLSTNQEDVGSLYRYEFKITEHSSGAGLSIHPERVGLYDSTPQTYTRYIRSTVNSMRFYIHAWTGKLRNNISVKKIN